jgi:hypothetical protein
MTNGIELNQYQIVSTTESGKKYKMEQGKKWRQFLAGVLCECEFYYIFFFFERIIQSFK